MINHSSISPPRLDYNPIHPDQELAGVPLVQPDDSSTTPVGHNASLTVLTPLYIFSDDGDVWVEQRRIQVYSMWVRGIPLYQICRELHHAASTIKSDIGVIQDHLRTVKVKDIEIASERSIAHLRDVQAKCYAEMDNPANARQLSSLLNTIVRCEEQIARIEGLIVERSLQKTDSTHHIKLYDFRDTLPPPQAQVVHPDIHAALPPPKSPGEDES